MILSEGRKEEILSKYIIPILAEKKLVKDYLSGGALGSIYDYLITDLFIIDTNFKYLDDILRNYYRDWNRPEEDIQPLSFETAKRYIMEKRDEIDRLVEALKFFDIHNKKYKYQEFKKYVDNDLFYFLKETDEIREQFNKKKGEKEVEKIYENDRILVVRPKTYEASCVYGAGTRWCTSSKSTSTHFDNYNETGSLYYFITKGVDSSNKFYKVALYRDNDGIDTWWDATDRQMAENEIELLTSAYGDALISIDSDFEKLERVNPFLSEIFTKNYNLGLEKQLLSGKPAIDLYVGFFVKDTIEPSTAKIECFVFQIDKKGGDEKLLGNYILNINLKCSGSVCFFNIVFTEPKLDMIELGGKELEMLNNVLGKTSEDLKQEFFQKLFYRIFYTIQNNQNFLNTLIGQNEILVSSENKGYSFKFRDRGLIKKLTDWLDSGKKTDKIDFFLGTNILRKRGNDFISTSTGNKIEPRGYLSTFFQAVIGAGIIDFKRVGRKHIIIKGPNYNKFMKGAKIRYF